MAEEVIKIRLDVAEAKGQVDQLETRIKRLGGLHQSVSLGRGVGLADPSGGLKVGGAAMKLGAMAASGSIPYSAPASSSMLAGAAGAIGPIAAGVGQAAGLAAVGALRTGMQESFTAAGTGSSGIQHAMSSIGIGPAKEGLDLQGRVNSDVEGILGPIARYGGTVSPELRRQVTGMKFRENTRQMAEENAEMTYLNQPQQLSQINASAAQAQQSGQMNGEAAGRHGHEQSLLSTLIEGAKTLAGLGGVHIDAGIRSAAR